MPVNIPFDKPVSQDLYAGTSDQQVNALTDLLMHYDTFAKKNLSLEAYLKQQPAQPLAQPIGQPTGSPAAQPAARLDSAPPQQPAGSPNVGQPSVPLQDAKLFRGETASPEKISSRGNGGALN
jgi:hypothetical protein